MQQVWFWFFAEVWIYRVSKIFHSVSLFNYITFIPNFYFFYFGASWKMNRFCFICSKMDHSLFQTTHWQGLDDYLFNTFSNSWNIYVGEVFKCHQHTGTTLVLLEILMHLLRLKEIESSNRIFCFREYLVNWN